MRICFFGDSFVNGTGDDDGLGWVGRALAGACQRGCDVTGYNLGIRGDTSEDVAARWKREASLRLPAECDGRLVFSFGANDCATNPIDDRPRIERAQSLALAQAILEAAHSWRPTLMVGPGIIASDREATARICELSAEYARLCRRIGVPYLPLCELILAFPTWSNEALARDGAHPNRDGYRRVADAVSNWPAWRSWTDGLSTQSK